MVLEQEEITWRCWKWECSVCYKTSEVHFRVWIFPWESNYIDESWLV